MAYDLTLTLTFDQIMTMVVAVSHEQKESTCDLAKIRFFIKIFVNMLFMI